MPNWHEQWDPDPGHITGIQNERIYLILSAASEETRVNEMTRAIDSEMKKGKVVRRAAGPDGKAMGTYDDNPILNTVLYEVDSQTDKSESMQPM